MYGQGNFAPQFGQGPRLNTPAVQQHPPATPSLPFQQGTQVSHPSMSMPDPAPALSNACQLDPSVYQQAHPHPRPSNPVPPNGVLSLGQSYRHPPPPPPPQMHVSVQNSYTYVHNAQWPRSAHHIPPPPLPCHGLTSSGQSCPEMLPSSSAPMIPPPPPQGQARLRVQLQPPPPLCLASNFLVPTSLASFTHQGSQIPSASPPPPPPPSSPPGPPPLPPSSPSPTSSPNSTAIKNCAGIDVMKSHTNVLSDVSDNNDLMNHGKRTVSILDSNVHDGIQPGEIMKPDLSSLPQNSVEDQNIKYYCRLSAKDGPKFEDMAPKEDVERPKFGSSKQSRNSLKDGILPHSPIDSDMDMEDDITLPDEAQITFESAEAPKHEIILVSCKAAKGQLNTELQEAEVKGPACSNSEGSRSKGKLVLNLAGTSKCSLDSNVDNISVPQIENLSPSKASIVDASISSQQNPVNFKTTVSPFRLLQDYSSDDGSENDEITTKTVNEMEASPQTKLGNTSWDRRLGDLEADLGLKTGSECNDEIQPFFVSVMKSSLSKPSGSFEAPGETEVTTRNDKLTEDECAGSNHGIKRSADNNSFQQKDSLISPEAVTTSVGNKLVTENAEIKVDKFGRLIREGYSDSDSDGPSYAGRHVRTGRSRSRSQSPNDQRRRRSPWRRREHHSRSRSRSPRKRRSRSRSPFRRGSDRNRWEKSQHPQCFNFLRGKCYRGALCRYSHNDSGRKVRTSNYDVKQIEAFSSSRSHEFSGDNETRASKKSVHELELKSQVLQPLQDTSKTVWGHSRDKVAAEESTIISVGKQNVVSGQGVKSLVTAEAESESTWVTAEAESESTWVTAEVQEKLDREEERHISHLCVTNAGSEINNPTDLVDNCIVAETAAENLPDDMSPRVPSSGKNLVIQESESHHSDLISKKVDEINIADHSAVQALSTEVIPFSERHQSHLFQMQPSSSETISSEPETSRGLSLPISEKLSDLPPPPSTLSQGIHADSVAQIPRDHNIMPAKAPFPLYSTAVENPASYHAPIPYQYSYFAVPFNSSWSSLPPPPRPQQLPLQLPPQLLSQSPQQLEPKLQHTSFVSDSTLNSANALHVVNSLQFQQQLMPRRKEFVSLTIAGSSSNETHTHSEVDKSRNIFYPPTCEPLQPFANLMGSRMRTVPVNSHMNQLPGATGMVQQGPLTEHLDQSLVSSNLFTQGSIHSKSLPLANESISHVLCHSATDSVIVPLGDPAVASTSVSMFTPEFFNRNQLSHVLGFGGSRIMSHHNPYASTFDRPLLSKFTSNYFKDKQTSYSSNYSAQFISSHAPADVQETDNLGSRNMISLRNSARVVERSLPRSGGDQYDPLFDSIEPSSNSLRKSDFGQKHETTNDLDIKLKPNGSNRPLDVEENNKQRAAAVITVTMSSENEEYGETADAEVGVVENESLSDPVDEANMAMGEVEIDQVKKSGKMKKKSKDSRSMKLFKVSLTNFVKEVLKPSWRQGRMSKEAFKTIVKKTVEKVSGAMKGHHIPKSQAKINQYIDSSQRKLTKLVMGYVDKYVKV